MTALATSSRLPTILDRQADPSFSLPPFTPTQVQVDHLVAGFIEGATDWRTLTAMMVGGMAYRVGKIAVLSSMS